MFDELASINKQIRKWEGKVEEEFNGIKESMLNSLYAMKEGLQRRIQKQDMEQELNRRFEQHIENHKEQLRRGGVDLSRSFSMESNHLKRKIEDNYEAASSKKVEENFENTRDEVWQLDQDFTLIVSTCRKRGF